VGKTFDKAFPTPLSKPFKQFKGVIFEICALVVCVSRIRTHDVRPYGFVRSRIVGRGWRGVEDVAPYGFVQSLLLVCYFKQTQNRFLSLRLFAAFIVGGDLRTPREVQCRSRALCGCAPLSLRAKSFEGV
jgi:hypothetical protein